MSTLSLGNPLRGPYSGGGDDIGGYLSDGKALVMDVELEDSDGQEAKGTHPHRKIWKTILLFML